MPKANRAACWFIACALVAVLTVPVLGAPATIKKSVQKLEDGNYLIKMVVTASKDGVYGFDIKDPKGAIVDVFAPNGWCILSDGEISVARSDAALKVGKGIEFTIYATSEDTQYIWTFFGDMEQIGKPEVL